MSEVEKEINELEDQHAMGDHPDKTKESKNPNVDAVEEDEGKLNEKKSSEPINDAEILSYTGPALKSFITDQDSDDSTDLFPDAKQMQTGNDVVNMPGPSQAANAKSKTLKLVRSQKLITLKNEETFTAPRPMKRLRTRESAALNSAKRPKDDTPRPRASTQKSSTQDKSATPKATRGRPKKLSYAENLTPTKSQVKRSHSTFEKSDRVLRSASKRSASKKIT